ncbi:hypothetical protein [Streptomyces sp. NPDC002994]|uniref:hypothetical protein n=1 Tax=Streptomyces sp. NPDC002994 TaxID=3154441 RepID=UPI0033A4AD1E
MTGAWYVLVEESRIDFDRWEDCHRWQQWELALTEHVEGGSSDAEAAGTRLAESHVPDLMFIPEGDRPQRCVFRMQDGSWLVKLNTRHTETHFRVSTGQLVHTEEETTRPVPEYQGKGFGTWAGLKFLLSLR